MNGTDPDTNRAGNEDLTLEDVDRQIRELEPWVVRAAAALLTLWNDEPNNERFDRDTTTRYDTPGNDEVPTKGRVSSVLALPALMDYRRYLEEGPEALGDQPDFEAILGGDLPVLRKHIPNADRVECAICGTARTVESWCREKERRRQFEDHSSPQYLFSLTALALYQHSHFPWHECHRCPSSSRKRPGVYRGLQKSLEQELKWDPKSRRRTGRPVLARHGKRDDDEQNYYVTFAVLRALDVCRRDNRKGDNAIWDVLGRPVRLGLTALVGERLGHIGTQCTVADVAFAAVVLDRLEEENAARLIDKAVELVVAEQRSDGSWPCPPVISKGESVLEISSYDIAYGLSCLLLNQFSRERYDNAAKLLCSFQRVFELVRLSQQTVRPGTAHASDDAFVGWASDGSRSPQVVTTYTTGRILSFLIRYHDALLSYRQHLVLAKYSVRIPPPGRQTLWQDVQLSLDNRSTRVAVTDERAAHTPLHRLQNPFDELELADVLDKLVAEPVRTSPIKRPGQERVSFFLTGPPGTGKTTLVELLAEHLQWPLMVLSPPDFLREGGLASILRVATEVFSDVLRLRRVVLLLDECEELFRNRYVGADRLATTEKDDSTTDGGSADGQHGEARAGDDGSGAQQAHDRQTGAERTEGAFLTAAMLPRLQELHDRQWVIFALATNVMNPEHDLDEAALRRGRFDFEIQMPRPELRRRQDYLQRELKQLEAIDPRLRQPLDELVELERKEGYGWPDLEELKGDVVLWLETVGSDERSVDDKLASFTSLCTHFQDRKARKRGTRDIVHWQKWAHSEL